jgi:hypothetical protein
MERKTIVIISSLDTKGIEASFLKTAVEGLGHRAILMEQLGDQERRRWRWWPRGRGVGTPSALRHFAMALIPSPAAKLVKMPRTTSASAG